MAVERESVVIPSAARDLAFEGWDILLARMLNLRL